MSLYYEAASVLDNAENGNDSLKTRIYTNKSFKSSPGHLFAVVSETAKWSPILKDVIEKSGLLKLERKLTPALALLLTHDLLLAKRGVMAPASHVLKLAITRHKARLSAEFTKIRVKRGFASIQAWQQQITADASAKEKESSIPRPRWLRLNTIPGGDIRKELKEAFANWEQAKELSQVSRADATENIYYIDETVPNLIAVPKDHLLLDPHLSKLFSRIIYQDKASCFPALLLDPKSFGGDAIDACAAPGNKTTHLAALMKDAFKTPAEDRRVIAFERNPGRGATLKRMVRVATANTEGLVKLNAPQDYLDSDPKSTEFDIVQALLLDPSCSGSGMPRDDNPFTISMPESTSSKSKDESNKSRPAKRKRKEQNEDMAIVEAEEEPEDEVTSSEESQQRLTGLSSFQLRIIEHAMKFPAARRITYSTCSVHWAENESVVMRALASDVAKERGWRILARENQFPTLSKWKHRGIGNRDEASEFTKDIDPSLSVEDKELIIDSCIRCYKGTEDGTHGFFVAGFVRDVESKERAEVAEKSLKRRDVQSVEEEEGPTQEGADRKLKQKATKKAKKENKKEAHALRSKFRATDSTAKQQLKTLGSSLEHKREMSKFKRHI